jgi:hypothetical protein
MVQKIFLVGFFNEDLIYEDSEVLDFQEYSEEEFYQDREGRSEMFHHCGKLELIHFGGDFINGDRHIRWYRET